MALWKGMQVWQREVLLCRRPKLNFVVRVLNFEKSSFYAHKISMIPPSEKLESLVSVPEVSTSRLQTLFRSSPDLKTDL